MSRMAWMIDVGEVVDVGDVVKRGFPVFVYDDEDDEAPLRYTSPPPFPIRGKVWLVETDVHAASYGVHVIRVR